MSQSFDYKQAADQLDQLLVQLQSTDLPIDKAVDLYQKGQKLVTEIEAYLKNAENTIKKHTKVD